jgi:hypothetical protein
VKPDRRAAPGRGKCPLPYGTRLSDVDLAVEPSERQRVS